MSEVAALGEFAPVVRNGKRQVISVHFKLVGELGLSLSMGHGLDRSDLSTHVHRSEILICP